MSRNPLTNKLLGRRQNPPFADSVPELEAWFAQECGQQILQQEEQVLGPVLEKLFGYHLLQISPCRDQCLYQDSKIQHCFSLNPLRGNGVGAVCNEEALPLESESIDVAVLHHVLDYTQEPHQLLKEVSRVVLPSGHVLVVGFNPLSFFGLWSLLGRFRQKAIFRNHLLTLRRLADWLTFMDFTIQEVSYGFYKPPVNSLTKSRMFAGFESVMRRFKMPFGGFYVVLAKKEVSRITPIKQQWRMKPSIIPSIEPSMYASKKDKKTTIH